MKRYLIQIRGYRSGDSSHRVSRFISCAENLNDLCEQLKGISQEEIEILAQEEMTVCDLGIHAYKVMYNKGTCTLCGKEFKGDVE